MSFKAKHIHEKRLTRERLVLLTRVYHSAKYAAEAIGSTTSTVEKAAARYGLKFRRKGSFL